MFMKMKIDLLCKTIFSVKNSICKINSYVQIDYTLEKKKKK